MSAVLNNPPMMRALVGQAPRLARLAGRHIVRVVEPSDGHVPDNAWSLDELTARTIAEQKIINEADRAPTRHYWYQGRALNAARKRFHRGSWRKYLERCEISDDQARTARKLARLYDNPEFLIGLSVREALRLAKGGASSADTARLLRNLAARLRNTIKAIREVAQAVETSGERAALARSTEKTVAALSALSRALNKGEAP